MPDLLESSDAGRGDRSLTAITAQPVPLTRTTPTPVDRGPEVGPPILLFQQVSKWYGPVIGVNQVTLELRPGITGLVGHNGCGKSTLLRLAAGQVRPSIGAVQVVGHDAWSAEAKRHIGYCPELDTFYEEMSGRRFVQTMASLCGYSRTEALRRSEETLQLVGMAERADRKIAGYSKGMRQRIKLAQALLHDPELLLLDEPLSGIDPIGRRESVALFKEIARRGKCLLISSHELEELEKLTDHVAIMAAGRIAAVGTLTQIRDLLDNHPLSIRIESDQNRLLAGLLLEIDDVVGVDRDDRFLTVRAKNPRRFFSRFGEIVLDRMIEVRHLEALDESTHDVLGYLLGGNKN
ncbi:MAG TPA: ABC transporter ATP-binding protein [Gemmataceae bacterium]|nr:ABC transporter ATP-binding protein [Gemmataceae bacterium]